VRRSGLFCRTARRLREPASVARQEVSLGEASLITGLSTKALRERIYRGTLPARKLGGQYRIATKALEGIGPRTPNIEKRLTELERRVKSLEDELGR
jgi:hypothetical protein